MSINDLRNSQGAIMTNKCTSISESYIKEIQSILNLDTISSAFQGRIGSAKDV